MIMARIASMLRANLVLKCRDAVLAKIKTSITFEGKIELRNVPIFCLTELLPSEMVSKAAE